MYIIVLLCSKDPSKSSWKFTPWIVIGTSSFILGYSVNGLIHDSDNETHYLVQEVFSLGDIIVPKYNSENNELISSKAGLAFPIRDGIPIMLVDDARTINKA